MISSANNEDLPQRVIVKVPAEIWTCEVSASYNPNAESEAMVIESIVSEGSLERWSKAHNGSNTRRPRDLRPNVSLRYRRSSSKRSNLRSH